MRFNKYLPFAFIYFFVNSAGLPLGLTYTALLGPFFYAWVVLKRKKEILLPFLVVLAPFIAAHILFGDVDIKSYVISLVNIILIYFFCQAVYTFLVFATDHEKIFRKVLIANFILCLIAMVFYFTPWNEFFWIRQNITQGVDQFLRLKLFTYEAAYYAQLFIPVFLYYFLLYILGTNKMNNRLLILMIFLPLLLSFSIGVLGCLLFSLIVTLVIHFRTLAPKRRFVNFVITATALVGVAGFILLFFFRDNPFFLRISNIVLGTDTSGEGRTKNAFFLALKILQEKNEFWGIGPGQLKFIGEDIIRGYYLYYDRTPVAIPNTTAETLLVLGWAGITVKFFIEIFLFIRTRVWTNYYRLTLFLFMFSYQFTGSYLTNTVEYVIWIFAFTNVFREFDVNSPAQGSVFHTHQ